MDITALFVEQNFLSGNTNVAPMNRIRGDKQRTLPIYVDPWGCNRDYSRGLDLTP